MTHEIIVKRISSYF